MDESQGFNLDTSSGMLACGFGTNDANSASRSAPEKCFSNVALYG